MSEIDVVLPWVNGQDLDWQQTLFELYPEKKLSFDSERYRDWELLRYWFRGIESYAPWIRKIHFVTCGQIPEWLNFEHPKINIVRHSDYIPKKYLPVFSSHPIEIFINKIPGLSEKFIYFNDDIFLLKKVDETDFFRGGLPCDIAGFNAITPGGISHVILNDIAIINDFFNKKSVIKNNLSKWLNFNNFDKTLRTLALLPWPNFTGFFDHHLAQPYLKKTMDEVWNRVPDSLLHTAKSKLRNNEDVNMYLFRYWHLCQGEFYNIPLDKYGKYYSINDSSVDEIATHIRCQGTKLITLNDESNLNFDMCKMKIKSAFNDILPNISQFEAY